MNLIISHILPPKNIANEIADILPTKAPNLFKLITYHNVDTYNLDLTKLCCTALESVILDLSGYKADNGFVIGQGLGPLNIKDNIDYKNTNPIWLIDLISLQFLNKNMELYTAEDLLIKKEESEILFDISKNIFMKYGFQIFFENEKSWRILLPNNFQPKLCISPQLAKTCTINNIFDITENNNIWRILLNNIQILWKNHEINNNRIKKSLLPINSIWLYGGSKPWNISPTFNKNMLIIRDLEQYYINNDWYMWLETLEKIDNKYINKYININNSNINDKLILLGLNYKVDIKFNNYKNIFVKWLYKKNWRNWWNQNIL